MTDLQTQPETQGTGESRNRRSRERVLQAIRTAAMIEFSLSGLKGTSTQGIAERAGLNKSKLHYYISGKDELYNELLANVLGDWKDLYEWKIEADGSYSRDPGMVLGEYIYKKLEYSFSFPELSKIFARELLDGGSNLTEYWPELRQFTKKNVDYINYWIGCGLMQPLDPHNLLLHIWSITQRYADFTLQVREVKGLRPNDPLDREAIIKDVTTFILRGCGIAPPAR